MQSLYLPHIAEKQLHSLFFHLTQKMLLNRLTKHLIKTEECNWRLIGRTQSQENGCDIHTVAETIRINVKIIHGLFFFYETAPAYYSNFQFGNTLSPAPIKETNCYGCKQDFSLLRNWKTTTIFISCSASYNNLLSVSPQDKMLWNNECSTRCKLKQYKRNRFAYTVVHTIDRCSTFTLSLKTMFIC